MNKYLKLSLPLIFTLLSLSYSANAWIMEVTVTNFEAFYQIVKATDGKGHILCCSDIDDTVLYYPNYTGSESWFGYLYDGLKSRGILDPMPVMFSAAITAHDMNTDVVTPTEKATIPTLNNLKIELGIPCIGLTSRTYILSDITKSQLQQPSVQLTFCNPWSNELILNTDPTWIAVYKPLDGIVYCSGNNKGEILVELLKKTQTSINGKIINTIIVIDNDQKHLTRIKKAIKESGIDVNLMLFAYKGQTQPPLTPNPKLEKYLDYLADMAKRSQENIIAKNKSKARSEAICQILAQPTPQPPTRSASTPSLPHVVF